jgi:hypothetical protein
MHISGYYRFPSTLFAKKCRLKVPGLYTKGCPGELNIAEAPL